MLQNNRDINTRPAICHLRERPCIPNWFGPTRQMSSTNRFNSIPRGTVNMLCSNLDPSEPPVSAMPIAAGTMVVGVLLRAVHDYTSIHARHTQSASYVNLQQHTHSARTLERRQHGLQSAQSQRWRRSRPVQRSIPLQGPERTRQPFWRSQNHLNSKCEDPIYRPVHKTC